MWVAVKYEKVDLGNSLACQTLLSDEQANKGTCSFTFNEREYSISDTKGPKTSYIMVFLEQHRDLNGPRTTSLLRLEIRSKCQYENE